MSELKISINYKQAIVLLSGLLTAADQVAELHVLPPKWGTALLILSVVASAFLGKLKEAAAPDTKPDAAQIPVPPAQ